MIMKCTNFRVNRIPNFRVNRIAFFVGSFYVVYLGKTINIGRFIIKLSLISAANG